MCIAAAGKIIEIGPSGARADVRGNIVPVELGIVEAVIGDYVLIHAGLAIAKMEKDEAEEMDRLKDMVDGYAD